MSKRLARSLPALKQLLKSTSARRKVILSGATDELVHAICEICLNVLSGVIPLSTSQFNRLSKKRKQIIAAADRRVHITKKRRLINQKGGFLAPLLAVAVPFLANLLGGRS